MSTILLIIAGLYVAAVLLAFTGFAYMLIVGHLEKLEHEQTLIDQQANHIAQTALGEQLNREANQKAFEQQGISKFRTEIARLGGDLAKVEEKLGSKIKAVSSEVHETELAKSRAIILNLDDQLARFNVPFAGQTEPTNVAVAIPPGEGTALGSPV